MKHALLVIVAILLVSFPARGEDEPVASGPPDGDLLVPATEPAPRASGEAPSPADAAPKPPAAVAPKPPGDAAPKASLGDAAKPAVAAPAARPAVEAHPKEAAASTSEAITESPLLVVSARIDAAFSGGDPAVQGFSIPSVRLSASGNAAPNVGYRLSLGQTREYSSQLVPQVIPTEAFIRLDSVPRAEAASRPHASFSLGMFTPSLNPWWTPDLGDLNVPDYQGTHRALLLSRDVGAELSLVPVPDRLEIAIGAFNGNGIVGLNTNNAKAFTAFLRAGQPIGPWKIIAGAGGYVSSQSNVGSVNYRSEAIADVFLSVELSVIGLELNIEGFGGKYEDSRGKLSPMGGAGTITLGTDWLKAFGRYQSLTSAPTATGVLKQFEFGPMYQPFPSLRIFGLYQSVDTGTGSLESSGTLRMRLTI